MKKRCTSEETQYLCAHYATLTNAEIAKTLGRTENSAQKYAGRLGLSQPSELWTPAEDDYLC